MQLSPIRKDLEHLGILSMGSGLRIVAVMVGISLVGITGCGIKGPLEPPPSATGGSGETGAGTPGTKPEDPTHDPFILDRILR